MNASSGSAEQDVWRPSLNAPLPVTEEFASEPASDLASALAEVQSAIALSGRAGESDSTAIDPAAAEARLREAASRYVAVSQSSLAHYPRPADLGYLFRPALPVFLVMGTRVHASAFREAHGLRGADVVCALATEASGESFRKLEVRRVEVVEVESWKPMQVKDADLARASLARAAELNARNGWDEARPPIGQLVGGFVELTDDQAATLERDFAEYLHHMESRRNRFEAVTPEAEARRMARRFVALVNFLQGGAS